MHPGVGVRRLDDLAGSRVHDEGRVLLGLRHRVIAPPKELIAEDPADISTDGDLAALAMEAKREV